MPTKTPDCRELADDILKRITWYPESYDQNQWQTVAVGFLRRLMPKGGSTKTMVKEKQAAAPTLQNCQTTGCIAGTASILVGDVPAVSFPAGIPDYGGDTSVGSVITPEGEERAIQDRGAELLCLTSDEQEWLFAGSRTVPEVVWALREIHAGKRISQLYEHRMTDEQKADIRAYRHQLRAQKPKVSYVATNKLAPRLAKERAARKQNAEAGPQGRP